jgi:microcystin-dependent protein
MSTDITVPTKKDVMAITRALVLRNNRLVPTGSIQAYAGMTAPPGWLMCDGSEVSKNTYYYLYSIIGDIWRGPPNDADKFILPNMQGRHAIGAGTGDLLTNRILAATGGYETHTLTVDEMPAHTHTNVIQNGVQSIAALSGGSTTAAEEVTATINSGSTGGNNPHNIMSPFLVVNYIIKY